MANVFYAVVAAVSVAAVVTVVLNPFESEGDVNHVEKSLYSGDRGGFERSGQLTESGITTLTDPFRAAVTSKEAVPKSISPSPDFESTTEAEMINGDAGDSYSDSYGSDLNESESYSGDYQESRDVSFSSTAKISRAGVPDTYAEDGLLSRDSLQESYEMALTEDPELAEEIKEYIEELDTLSENEAANEEGEKKLAEEALQEEQLQQEELTQEELEKEPQDKDFPWCQNRPPPKPGVFRCPCPSDANYDPNWKRYYNSEIYQSLDCG